MKKKLLIFGSIAIFLIAVWTSLLLLDGNDNVVNVRGLLDKEYLLALELDDLDAQMRSWEEHAWYTDLSEMEDFQSFQKVSDLFTDLKAALSTEKIRFYAFLKKQSKNKLGFVHVVRLDPEKNPPKWSTVKAAIQGSRPDLEITERSFQSLDFVDIVDKKKSLRYSLLMHENLIIGSEHSVLIEDMIRLINRQQASDRKLETAILEEPSSQLHLRFENLAELIRIMSRDEIDVLPVIDFIGDFSDGHFGDFQFRDDRIGLNGKLEPDSLTHFSATFKGLRPGSQDLKHLIPTRTTAWAHVSVENGKDWSEKLRNHRDVVEKEEEQKRANFKSQSGRYAEEFFDYFGQEIAIAYLERINPNIQEKVIVIQLKDEEGAIEFFDEIAANVHEAQGDSIYSEQYSGYRIGRLDFPEFPSLLLGRQAGGFPSTYYFLVGSSIVLSNTVATGKSLLLDLETENTWGKTLRFSEYLASNITDAHFSFYVNFPRLRFELQENLSREWRQVYNKNETLIRSIELMGFQLSQMQEGSYTLSQLLYQPNRKGSRRISFEPKVRMQLDAPATTKAFVVKNHNDNSREILIQDQDNQLYLFNRKGDLLWKKVTDEAVNGEVHQVDLYKNGKLQYLFIGKRKIHLIDRNGNYVEGFPFSVAGSDPIAHLSLVDYDLSKNYRLLLTKEGGKIYMYDMSAKALEGWNPFLIESDAATAADHFRVEGKDFIYSLQKDGRLHLMNRRGEMRVGFPLALKTDMGDDLFVEKGEGLYKSFFHLVNREGEYLRIDIDGNLQKREQLYKADNSTKFYLVPEEQGKGFVKVRLDLYKIAVISRLGDLIFEQNYTPSEKMSFQYYNFGTDRQLYSLTDEVQGFSYLYDQKGKLLNDRPIESNFEISVLYYESQGKYEVYHVYNDELMITEFEY
ncbi:MAG: hypothetical protein LAT68_01325 [Cyclobacteriaceae bacterium]|nr:hypothetical protein [Cyclobacteriaceae bacterium]MCH8514944.1 hypothetical protein [Cyclobacteriaceae bacterium]